MYTYKPKMGDVVRFPNGVEVNYSEASERLIVIAPKDKTLVISETTQAQLDLADTVQIGVE